MKQPEQTKKPYKTPRLEVYGDIRQITLTVAMIGSMDGGTGTTDKTNLLG